jgi:alpha-D-ribose 1-methylphosphonate 5-triphosphate diphosphatase
MMERGVPPSQAVNYVSLNPARILGLAAEFGSIEVGKKADLVALHLRDAYPFVTAAWVDGRLKLQLGLPVPQSVAVAS